MTIITIIMTKLLIAIFIHGTHFTLAVCIRAKKIIITSKIVKIRETFIGYTLLIKNYKNNNNKKNNTLLKNRELQVRYIPTNK